MSKKALGADINEFYNNILPDDCTVEYMHDYLQDDLHWSSDNKLSLYDTELYDLDDFGEVHYSDSKVIDFIEAFLEWKLNITTAKLFVMLNKAEVENIKNCISAIPGVITVEEVQSMKDQKYSNAFLEWRQKFQKDLNSRQNNPFSPEANSYFYAIEDHKGESK